MDAFLSNDYKRQLSGALFPGCGCWPGEGDEQHPSWLQMFLPLPSSAELWLCEMFSTPSWMSWAPPGDREVTCVPPHSLVAQWCPSRGHTSSHRWTEQWAGSGAGIKQSSSVESQQQGTPGLWAARALPWSANTTEHSERNTESKCVGRSGFSAFLKLLLRRQH